MKLETGVGIYFHFGKEFPSHFLGKVCSALVVNSFLYEFLVFAWYATCKSLIKTTFRR